ncbi:MAG TPA: exosortase-associated EpsI family protein [Planctomycetota bacterium]
MILLRALGWSLCYAGALLACLMESGVLASARAPDLARLPRELGPLTRLAELDFDPTALGATPPERHSFQAVRDAAGREGRLFLAYYERAQRWSGRPHDLELCYAAAGWRESEAHRLDEAHRPWSRLFEREGADGAREAVRVVHWLERPGPDEDRVSLLELGRRLFSGNGLRPDVIAAYFEFPADAAPPDADAARAVAALSAALEDAWRAGDATGSE